jgi:predicted TIM-barrel fold metal-dependent hydrolase
MPLPITRRTLLASAFAAPLLRAARPVGTLVDTHVHLFSSDPKRFPYPADAPYKPEPAPLEAYAKFVAAAKIDHTIIVHPEPYQDDHSYLEYCFANEPSKGFFKGTLLLDPISPQTPARMEQMVRKHPGRIVALRIHQVRPRGIPPSSSGPIKERDMTSPAVETTWRKAQDLGVAIQMHFLPHVAPQIADLARKFPNLPVILDHLGRAGQGTAADTEELLKLAKLPRVYMKYSGVNYSSKVQFPFADAKPLVRRAYDAFGPSRIIWGGLGASMEEFEKQVQLFDSMFDYASESDRKNIRGENAMKLFKF